MFVTFANLGYSGRLGNQLFQIACVIGTARRCNCRFVFPPWAYAKFFRRWIPQSVDIRPACCFAERAFTYDEIPISQSTDLCGCFQSEAYFESCADEIRRWFSPRRDLHASIAKRYGPLLARETCSVHVRRGDYVALSEYVDLAATDYYERAMACFGSSTTFVFFSDDVPWCQARFGQKHVYVRGESDVADLFLMSFCRNHIIANSTFSWWGAWLNPRADKQVIAPASWFAGSYNDPSIAFRGWPKYRGYHDTRDMIPATWTKI